MSARKGFTLVELMLSSVAFTLVMLLIVSGFVQITRTYTKGNTIKEVQANARSITQDITRQVRISDRNTVSVLSATASNAGMLCAGDIVYAWNHYYDANGGRTTQDVNGNPFEFIKMEEPGFSCTDASVLSTYTGEYEEIMPENLTVQHFNPQIIVGDTLSLKLILSSPPLDPPYPAVLSDTDLEQTGQNAACRPAIKDQYCSVTEMETAVLPRNVTN